MKNELMIHEWREEYLDLKLDDYILSFDDGLYSQVNGILKIIKKFPLIKIIYYFSTNILDTSQENKLYDPCNIAHDKYFKSNITSNYCSVDDLKMLCGLDNVSLGLHGHNHLNLKTLFKEYSLTQYYSIIKDDIISMKNVYLNMKSMMPIDKIYFCFPYNYVCLLYKATITKEFTIESNIELLIEFTGPLRKDANIEIIKGNP